MGDRTEIAWTDATWNPVSGCTRISTGCDNCYIERTPPFRMTGRKFRDHNGDRSHAPGSTTGVTLHEDRVDQPLRQPSWRDSRVFVCSLADLFHKDVPDEYIARVFAVMTLTPEVTYQVLTKRPARMQSLISWARFRDLIWRHATHLMGEFDLSARDFPWPLPNVWLGVSVENQKAADQRIPLLLDTPAAVRFLSCEPLLGPILLPVVCACGCKAPLVQAKREAASNPGFLNSYQAAAAVKGTTGLDWIIVGGESGPGALPMREEWAVSLVKQSRAIDVPVFVKQMGGERDKRGRFEDLPEDLRIREWPTPTTQGGQRGG